MARTSIASIKLAAEEADNALSELVASVLPPADVPPDAPVVPIDPASQLSLVPSEPSTPAPPAPPIATPVGPDATAALMHRLNTLEGMFNQTVAERDGLKTRVEALSKVVATLRQPPPAAPSTPTTLITDKDREEFGEDVISLATRAAQQAFLPLLGGLTRRLDALEAGSQTLTQRVSHVAEETQLTAQDRFKAELTRLVPGWEAQNTDAGFLTFLREVDNFTGASRYELLQQALERGDAERVSKFFLAFQPAAPQAEIPAHAPPAPPAPAARPVDPRTLISPSPSAPAAATTSPVSGKIWTTDEVSAVYDGHLKGKISKSDFVVLEAQIMKAFEEGRTRD